MDVTFSNYELSLNISGITIVVVCINSLDRKGGGTILLCSTFFYFLLVIIFL